jgi:hypothetical protein
MLLRAFITGTVVSSPQRWPPLVRFGTSFHSDNKKAEMVRDYLILLEELVIIANPIILT